MPNPVAISETAPQTALPAQVDIYDFDKTLVPFDSGSLFIGYCALHYPWVLVYLPVWFLACLLFALRVLSLQRFKNLCFGFLPMVPVQRAAKGFWEKHLHLVYPKETPSGDHQRVTGFFAGGIATPTGATVSAVYPAQPKDRAYFRAELPR